jgi:hypothetical protein
MLRGAFSSKGYVMTNEKIANYEMEMIWDESIMIWLKLA